MMDADTRRGGRRRWRKRLLRAGVCLLLGAVTTVGVAIGLPEFGGGDLRRVNVAGASQLADVSVYIDTGVDRARISVALGLDMGEVSVARGWGAWETVAAATAAALPVEDIGELTLVLRLPEWIALPPMPRIDPAPWAVVSSTAETERRGWPWRAVMSRGYDENRWVNQAKQTVSSRTVGQVQIGDRTFPAQPIFPGLALDTLFYAVPCWFLIVTPGAIRRMRRRRKGRCADCGYDLAGLAVEDGARTCPECGAASRFGTTL